MKRSYVVAGPVVAICALLALSLGGCGQETSLEGEAGANLVVAVDSHLTHRVNGGTTCNDCHCTGAGCVSPNVHLLAFAPRAIAPGRPLPTFDLATQTCSNVACHMVPAGTFTYWSMGGDGEPAEAQVSYGGVPVTTPNWDSATTGSCRACHTAPPSPAAGAWHSGQHGSTAAMNDCSLCHPDVVLVNGALEISTATTCGPTRTASCAALHRNGVVDVTPRWSSRCFGCH
jgi:predicted CxxxxCH...CXXCH cytochrome family protein